MKLLVFGKTGQVAREIARRVPVGIELIVLDRTAADLSNPEACAAILRKTEADAVINAAAYTAVDKAEDEAALAQVINGDAPGAMARAAAERALPFVHISTDYVFDGLGEQPFTPDRATNPASVYGRSKRSGEEQVAAAGGAYAILRTSWVFSVHGSNFVKTMLKVGAGRDSLTVVADQIGGPTPASHIADAVLSMAVQLKAHPEKSGIYHFSGAPDTSWAGFARAVFETAGMNTEVEDIPTSAWPTPAARPLNSRMDCTSLSDVFEIGRPDWRAALVSVVQDLQKES
jgi:dTDP-4-dehydrorhamnose reductase